MKFINWKILHSKFICTIVGLTYCHKITKIYSENMKYKNSKIFSSAPGLTSRLMFAVNSNVLLKAKLNPAQHISSVLLPLSTTKREMVS